MKRYLIALRQNEGLMYYHVRAVDKGHAAESLYSWLKSQDMVTLPPMVSIVELQDLDWPQRVAYVATMDMDGLAQKLAPKA